MSGHKPGADHAENPEYDGLEETEGLIVSSTGTTGTTPEAPPGGRSRRGIAAVTGALLLGGSVTAYGVTSHGGSANSRQSAQALSLAADQADAETTALRQAQADNAADSAPAQIAAQHQAQAAGAKAAKAAADRAAAAAKANRDAQRKALTKPPARSTSPAPGRSSGSSSAAYGSAQAIAKQLVPASQYQCFATIVQRESGWNIHARNPSSGAYGLGQALPGSKMASAGPDWQNNPTTQIKWVLSYMDHRYGSPCAALSFWNSHGWY